MSEERLVPEAQVNAFDPAFLELLKALDDVGTAQESEFSGPWKLIAAEGGYALLRVYEEIGTGQPPEAVFKDLPSALSFFAVLPSVGRPPLVVMDSSRREDGYRLSRDGSPVGQLRVFNEGFVHAAHVADCLTRSPLCLASLLLASGPQAMREVGRVLSRVLTPAGAGSSWLTVDEFPPR
jgi:hypothetical protein